MKGLGIFFSSLKKAEAEEKLLWKCGYFYAVCNFVFISCLFSRGFWADSLIHQTLVECPLCVAEYAGLGTAGAGVQLHSEQGSVSGSSL